MNVASSAQEKFSLWTWLVDSGSLHYVSNNQSRYSEYADYPTPRPVIVGGDQVLQALGEGTILL